MLHASKFVNTKAYQKAQDRKDPLKFPLLSAKDAEQVQRHTEPDRVRLRSVIIAAEEESREKSAQVEIEKKAAIHPSVDLQRMQKQEELNKQEEDWMAFFTGKTEGCETQLELPAHADNIFGSDFSFATPQSAVLSFATEYGYLQETQVVVSEVPLAESVPSAPELVVSEIPEIIQPEILVPEIVIPDSFLQEICSGPRCLDEIFSDMDDKFRQRVN